MYGYFHFQIFTECPYVLDHINSFINGLNFFDRDRYFFHQVFTAVACDPYIIFDAYADLFFFNINSRLYGENHSCFYRLVARAEVMHVNAQVMGYAVVHSASAYARHFRGLIFDF